MPIILLIAVAGVLLLHLTGAIPLSSVGGPMVIALAVFCATLAVAIFEAWTKRRGVLGWIVNIVTSFVGTFVAAQLGTSHTYDVGPAMRDFGYAPPVRPDEAMERTVEWWRGRA